MSDTTPGLLAADPLQEQHVQAQLVAGSPVTYGNRSTVVRGLVRGFPKPKMKNSERFSLGRIGRFSGACCGWPCAPARPPPRPGADVAPALGAGGRAAFAKSANLHHVFDGLGIFKYIRGIIPAGWSPRPEGLTR
jgi:hypothetical protein